MPNWAEEVTAVAAVVSAVGAVAANDGRAMSPTFTHVAAKMRGALV